jgi:hypothetical protein
MFRSPRQSRHHRPFGPLPPLFMSFRSVLFWLHLAAALLCRSALIGRPVFHRHRPRLRETTRRLVRTRRPHASRRPPPPRPALSRSPPSSPPSRAPTPPCAPPRIIVSTRSHRRRRPPRRPRRRPYYLNPLHRRDSANPPPAPPPRSCRPWSRWHRYLGFTGETSRPRAKLLNGLANLAFTFLAISGLVPLAPAHLVLARRPPLSSGFVKTPPPAPAISTGTTPSAFGPRPS